MPGDNCSIYGCTVSRRSKYKGIAIGDNCSIYGCTVSRRSKYKGIAIGDNCSIYGCTVSRRSKYKGIASSKVPAPKTEFEKSWKNKLVDVTTKGREIDGVLRERIKSGKLFICQ